MNWLLHTSLLLILAANLSAADKSKTPAVEPDYTKGEKLTSRSSRRIGPIGISANIWASKGGIDSTKKARTIQVGKVYEGTPAFGVLKTGDVIQGVYSPSLAYGLESQKNFNDEAPKILALAISEAEKKENAGKITLKVWRKGKVLPVTVTLPTLGAYSQFSPYDCQKTESMIQNAVKSIYKSGSLGPRFRRPNYITVSLDGLGLLATGEKKHWPTVKTYVKHLHHHIVERNQKGGSWHLAYQNLFLTEYYLATKDAEALPIIKKLSMIIAGGRSGVGTWSHGMADPRQNNGKPYGIACAYGAMNQITITCSLSLVLAQKCGIRNEVIDKAVEKSTNYLRFYVEKGSIPYGDHNPGDKHDNNGSSAQAAVLFNIVGDKDAATYFTMMTLGSRRDREGGHTGPFFSRLWGALGAGCGGKYSLAAFSKMTRWRTAFSRNTEGGFVHEKSWGGEGKDRYRNWKTTGARLMHMCLPRKQLFITGKGSNAVEELSLKKVQEAMEAGEKMKDDKSDESVLLERLGHWSPAVRKEAAERIGRKGYAVGDQLAEMMTSDKRYAQYGAAYAMRYCEDKSEKAVDALIKLLNSESTTMRFFALQGLQTHYRRNKNGVSTVKRKAIPALIKISTKEFSNEYRPTTKTYAAYALFGQSNYVGLMGKTAFRSLSSKKRVELIKNLLKIDHGGALSKMSKIYKYLTKKEAAQLMPDLYNAAKTPAPSGVMFNKEGRSNALGVLARNYIKEGIQVAMDYMFEHGHGGKARRSTGIRAIVPYGQAFDQEFLKKLKATLKKNKDLARLLNTPKPDLISIREYMKKYAEIKE